MTEIEYIDATNLAKLRSAVTILHEVLICDGSAIDDKSFREIRWSLSDIRDKLDESIDID